MKVNEKLVPLLELTPDEGMHLQNIHTGEAHEGAIYPGNSLTAEDFREITDEEYQEILAEQEKENTQSTEPESEVTDKTESEEL
jgi:hypothetical protein